MNAIVLHRNVHQKLQQKPLLLPTTLLVHSTLTKSTNAIQTRHVTTILARGVQQNLFLDKVVLK